MTGHTGLFVCAMRVGLPRPPLTRATLSKRTIPPQTQADALKLAEQERDAYKKELNALELSLDITRQDLQGASLLCLFLSRPQSLEYEWEQQKMGGIVHIWAGVGARFRARVGLFACGDSVNLQCRDCCTLHSETLRTPTTSDCLPARRSIVKPPKMKLPSYVVSEDANHARKARKATTGRG